MELEEMKTKWEDMSEKQARFSAHQISDVTKLKYRKRTDIFKTAEIIGLLIAYLSIGFIVYKFSVLNHWYLQLSGYFLVIYLFVMPVLTIAGVWKMNAIDLTRSNYKEVLEHFHSAKDRLKKAEKVSFIASPFIFMSAIAVLAKVFLGINLFTSSVKLPLILLFGIAFSGVILFNIRAFKKREKQFQSVKQLLEEEK